jgi:hypothetical protein
LFGLAAVAVFKIMPARNAILLVFLGGWIILPFGRFAPVPNGTLAWWVTGLALPGDVMISKAWVAPLVAIAGGFFFGRKQIARCRPVLADLPMVAWCLWPFANAMMLGSSDPGSFAASAYLFGAWGLPWAIGRIWFSDASGQRLLLIGMAIAGGVCLPFAVLEGWQGPFLHDLIYGPHPFRHDGSDRYFWHRPIGFFEHGNQYGIWVSLCAVAAIWWAIDARKRSAMAGRLAALTSALAIASQSIGAVALGGGAVIAMRFWSKRVVRYATLFVIEFAIIAGAVQVSGLIPVRAFVEQTQAGQATLAMIRATGRGSVAWRVSQDLKTLDGVRAAPVFGNGRWDWWRRFGTRPWGLLMLIAGQYGLAGLALSLGSLVIAATRVLARRPHPVEASAAIALAMITLAALGDAIFNAFLFFPAILAAGAIAATVPDREDGGLGDEHT